MIIYITYDRLRHFLRDSLRFIMLRTILDNLVNTLLLEYLDPKSQKHSRKCLNTNFSSHFNKKPRSHQDHGSISI